MFGNDRRLVLGLCFGGFGCYYGVIWTSYISAVELVAASAVGLIDASAVGLFVAPAVGLVAAYGVAWAGATLSPVQMSAVGGLAAGLALSDMKLLAA